MSILISVIILIGLFFLSLVLPYPYKKLFGGKPDPKHIKYFHLIGWGLFVLSLALAIDADGIGVGITYWLGYLTLMALGLVAVFSYK